jgi:hypothetical protein
VFDIINNPVQSEQYEHCKIVSVLIIAAYGWHGNADLVADVEIENSRATAGDAVFKMKTCKRMMMTGSVLTMTCVPTVTQ